MHIIAGLYRRQKLTSPKGLQTRPTTSRLRETVFNICQQKIEGCCFLDLFAGSGAMGLEALSRGADFATFIESDRTAINCIESNVDHLHVKDKTQIYRGEAFAIMKKLEAQGQRFDIITADPPYHTFMPGTSNFYSTAIIQWLDSHVLLNQEGFLFVEEDARSKLNLSNLTKLKFIDSRRLGHTHLLQYRMS